MSNGWLVVLQKTATLFLLMVLGWTVARKGLWKSETSRVVSRFLVDIVYPCYVVVRLLRTIDVPVFLSSWYIPLLGFLVIATGEAVGLAASPLVRDPHRRRTFVFLAAQTNWIYLPLPIAEGLFGEAGVTAILLMNIGCTAAIWSIGVAALKPGGSPFATLKLMLNRGVLATLLGLLLALFVPPLRNGAPGLPVIQPLLQAADMLGLLMIPLSLLVIGAQLGEKEWRELRPEPALLGVLSLKLAAVPLAALGLTALLALSGLPIPEVPRLCFLLVAAMPPALSATLFTQRFGGDSLLSAKAVFFGTFASIATVPLFFRLVQALAP